MGSGVYVCRTCGKRTRETGDYESEVGLCADCNALSGNENTLNDLGEIGCSICGQVFTVWNQYLMHACLKKNKSKEFFADDRKPSWESQQ